MKRILSIFAIALSCLFLTGCFKQIDTGNVGVQRTLGDVKPEELGPGVYNTFFKTIDEFTTKEVFVSLNDLKPKAADNLTMEDVDIDVYYKVDPTKVADLTIKYQGDVARIASSDVLTVGEGRVSREAREVIYKAVGSMEATTMHTKRDELGEKVRSLLQEALDKTDKGAFQVTNINVKSLVTDRNIEASIRDRAKVDQEIQAKLKQKELAKAEAERRIIEAEGEAKANNIISASISPALKEIRLAEIQRETALAIASKAGNTVLMGGHASPLVNLK